MTKSCRTCAHLVVPLDRSGRRRVISHFFYECGYKIEWPVIPASVLEGFPFKSRMTGDQGTDCPVWKRLKK